MTAISEELAPAGIFAVISDSLTNAKTSLPTNITVAAIAEDMARIKAR